MKIKLGTAVLMLFSMMNLSASNLNGVESFPQPNNRTLVKVVSNSLVCTFDNISGAKVTIHVLCKVPLGYVLNMTTTPRVTERGGNVGSYIDDNGGGVYWLLQQKVKGSVSWQITDGSGGKWEGIF